MQGETWSGIDSDTHRYYTQILCTEVYTDMTLSSI